MGASEEEILRNAAKESCIGCRLPAILGKRRGQFIGCKGCTEEEAEAIADAWKKEVLRKKDKKAKKTNKTKILKDIREMCGGSPTFCDIAKYLGVPCGDIHCDTCRDSVVRILLNEWERSLGDVRNG